jgi:hypothetical protein
MRRSRCLDGLTGSVEITFTKLYIEEGLEIDHDIDDVKERCCKRSSVGGWFCALVTNIVVIDNSMWLYKY